MKEEGTGTPRNPEIEFTARVKARELRFERVPDTEVRFQGNTERNSVSKTRRENLPDRVREDVTYRDSDVRLRIASEIDLRSESKGGTERTREHDSDHPDREISRRAARRKGKR